MGKYFNNKKAERKAAHDAVIAAGLRDVERARVLGMKLGSAGMLGAVLEMCKDGKSVKEIQKFCEQMLKVQKKKDS